MAETLTAPAESSPAPVMEIDRGPLVNLTGDQRTEFRRTGELPEAPKTPAESSPADTVKVPKAEASASPAATPQENRNGKRKPDVEERIKTFSDENKRLRAEIDALKAPKPVAEQQAQPKPVEQPAPQTNRTKPTVEDKNTDGTPKYKTYEDFVEDLSDWKAERRWTENQRQQQQQAQAREFEAKVEETRARHDKFDETVQPTASAIHTDPQIPMAVKAMLGESEVLGDLLFTLGSDPKELAIFIQMAKKSPGKALRYIALTESLIGEELAGKAQPKAEAAPIPPVKPQTNAPKPPALVGGRNAAPPDEVESAVRANDYRRASAAFTRQALSRFK